MHIYPKDSPLLKLQNFNTQLTLKSKEQPFSYCVRLEGLNQKFYAQGKFKYQSDKFLFSNSFSNDQTWNIYSTFKLDESIKVFFHSPNIVDPFQNFSTAFRLTLEKQYQFFVESMVSQKTINFNFYAQKKYNWEEWKMRTILEMCLKNKQLQFQQLCHYAVMKDKQVKFIYQQNESSIMIQSPYKQKSLLAFKINRVFRLNKYNTSLNIGIKHYLHENLSLIAKLNQSGMGLIGVSGQHENIKFQISNKIQLSQNTEQNFPFQFRIQVEA